MEAEKSGTVKMQTAIRAIGSPSYDSPEKEFENARYVEIKGVDFMTGWMLKKAENLSFLKTQHAYPCQRRERSTRIYWSVSL